MSNNSLALLPFPTLPTFSGQENEDVDIWISIIEDFFDSRCIGPLPAVASPSAARSPSASVSPSAAVPLPPAEQDANKQLTPQAISSLFKGDALTWYVSKKKENSKDTSNWVEFKKALIEEYGVDGIELRQRLADVRCDGPVDVYIQKFREIENRISDMTSTDRIFYFLRRLPEEVAQKVRIEMQDYSKIGPFYKSAKRWGKISRSRTREEEGRKDVKCYERRVEENRLSRSSTDTPCPGTFTSTNLDVAYLLNDIQCFNCKGLGHQTIQCSSPRQSFNGLKRGLEFRDSNHISIDQNLNTITKSEILHGTFEREPCNILIDSKSLENYINIDFFYKSLSIRSSQQRQPQSLLFSLSLLNRHSIPLNGLVGGQLWFENFSGHVLAYPVANTNCDLILGMPFLESNKVSLELGRRKITTQDQSTVNYSGNGFLRDAWSWVSNGNC